MDLSIETPDLSQHGLLYRQVARDPVEPCHQQQVGIDVPEHRDGLEKPWPIFDWRSTADRVVGDDSDDLDGLSRGVDLDREPLRGLVLAAGAGRRSG